MGFKVLKIMFGQQVKGKRGRDGTIDEMMNDEDDSKIMEFPKEAKEAAEKFGEEDTSMMKFPEEAKQAAESFGKKPSRKPDSESSMADSEDNKDAIEDIKKYSKGDKVKDDEVEVKIESIEDVKKAYRDLGKKGKK